MFFTGLSGSGKSTIANALMSKLMEIGGRKEILMLVPVVFLVLPVTILFALFPGLVHFDVVAP